MKEFERIIDSKMLSRSEQESLFDLTLYLADKYPTLRLKELIDAINTFVEYRKKQDNIAPSGLSRAQRRAMKKANRKKGNKGRR